MKKSLLMGTMIFTSSLFAIDNPPSLSILTQYANTLVQSPSQTYMQLKNTKSDVKVSIDTYLSSTYDIANIPISYVYNNSFGLSAYISYAQSNYATHKNSGISDSTIEVSFNAGQFEDDVQFENNIFGLRYTFSTGDDALNLGSGSNSIAIFWDSTYIINDDWTAYGSLLWNIYLDDITIDSSQYDLGSEDILWFGVKHQCLFNEKIETSLKLNWQGKYNDIEAQNYDIVDATLQWTSDKLIKNVPLNAGLKLPLWSSSNVDNEVLFFIGIGVLF
jgi:hypothetical protein